MISFHKAEAADRVWAHEILKNCEYPGAEYAFSCMYLWSDYFGELGRVGDHLTQHASWRGRRSISTRQARAISRGPWRPSAPTPRSAAVRCACAA